MNNQRITSTRILAMALALLASVGLYIPAILSERSTTRSEQISLAVTPVDADALDQARVEQLLLVAAPLPARDASSYPPETTTTTVAPMQTTTTTTAPVKAKTPTPQAQPAVGALHQECAAYLSMALSAGWGYRDLARLEQIMWRESRCIPTVSNLNSNGTIDRGITQINSVNIPTMQKAIGLPGAEALFDAFWAIRSARVLFERAGFSWCPWNAPNYCAG